MWSRSVALRDDRAQDGGICVVDAALFREGRLTLDSAPPQSVQDNSNVTLIWNQEEKTRTLLVYGQKEHAEEGANTLATWLVSRRKTSGVQYAAGGALSVLLVVGLTLGCQALAHAHLGASPMVVGQSAAAAPLNAAAAMSTPPAIQVHPAAPVPGATPAEQQALSEINAAIAAMRRQQSAGDAPGKATGEGEFTPLPN
jgi:hypothetical protein